VPAAVAPRTFEEQRSEPVVVAPEVPRRLFGLAVPPRTEDRRRRRAVAMPQEQGEEQIGVVVRASTVEVEAVEARSIVVDLALEPKGEERSKAVVPASLREVRAEPRARRRRRER